MRGSAVPVPDLVGEMYLHARVAALAAGYRVTGVAPDGLPVPDDSEGVVVEQDPLPHEPIRPGHTIALRVGRPPGGAGDREPAGPLPLSHEGHGLTVDPAVGRGAVEDSGRQDAAPAGADPVEPAGGDPDLVPA